MWGSQGQNEEPFYLETVFDKPGGGQINSQLGLRACVKGLVRTDKHYRPRGTPGRVRDGTWRRVSLPGEGVSLGEDFENSLGG